MIRIAKKQDIDAIMKIVEQTIAGMTKENNPQWSKEYPATGNFLDDIANHSLFVYEKEGRLIGFLCINNTEAPEYAELHWNCDGPCMVLHRMAVDPSVRRTGIGQQLIAFSEEYATERRVHCLRTDTFSRNSGMNALFQKCGFKKTGEVYFRGIEECFNCYDKLL